MRACGIHLFQVIRWPLLFAIGCTLLGFFVNNEVVPRGHLVRRTLKTRVSVGAGLSILEPGRFITDFPNVKIYFARKDNNWLYDLVAYDYSNPEVSRMITADKALVIQDGADVKLDLYQMTVDPLDEKHPTMALSAAFVAASGDISTKGTRKNFFARELSETKVELMKRLVFAMASVCFVLIGIPLGIRSQRKESSIGMAIALAVALGYYVVVILMLSLESDFALHPEWLIWLPVVFSFGLAMKFIRKHL